MEKKLLVTALVLNYQGEKIISECLASVESQRGDFDLSIKCLDNGSTDDSRIIISQKHAGVKLLLNNNNESFTYSYNRLIADEKSDYYVIISNDVSLPNSDVFQRCLSELVNDQSVAAVGARSVRPDGKLDRIHKKNLTFWEVFESFSLPAFLRNDDRKNDVVNQTERSYVEVLQDSFVFLRSDSYDREKFFNENMRFYYTEDQICNDWTDAGWNLLYEPSIRVNHILSYSTRKTNKYKVYKGYLNDAIAYSRWRFGLGQGLLVSMGGYVQLPLKFFFWKLKSAA
ncbi:MAG: glycosyltransferase [Agarilytica sp.]